MCLAFPCEDLPPSSFVSWPNRTFPIIFRLRRSIAGGISTNVSYSNPRLPTPPLRALAPSPVPSVATAERVEDSVSRSNPLSVFSGASSPPSFNTIIAVDDSKYCAHGEHALPAEFFCDPS